MRNDELHWSLKWLFVLGFALILVHSVERIPFDLDNLKVVVGIPSGSLSREKIEEFGVVEIPSVDGGISNFIVLCDFERIDDNDLRKTLKHCMNKYVIFVGRPPRMDVMDLAQILDELNIIAGIVEFDESTDYMFKVTRVRRFHHKFFRVHRIKREEYTKLKLDLNSSLKRWRRALLERSVDLLYVESPPSNWKVNYEKYLEKISSMLKPFMVGEPRIPSKEWRTIYSTILALIVGFVLFQSHSSILSIPYLFLTLVFLFYRSIHSSELLALFLGALGPVSIYNLGRRKLKNSFISPFFMGFGAITVGYTVNAILSDFNHITQLYTYRGVKLSLLLLPFLVFVREFFDEKSGFLRSGEKLKMIDIFVFSVILAGGVYYILRSGNYSFVLNAERKFRDTIESIFIVRPRFKEIIGYAFLFFTLRIRERGLIGRYHFIFPVLGSLGIVGTVNTFCHIKSPIFIDLYRSFLGIIIGYTLGYVLISILGMKNPRVWTRGS